MTYPNAQPTPVYDIRGCRDVYRGTGGQMTAADHCHRCDRADCKVASSRHTGAPIEYCPRCVAEDECDRNAVDWRARALESEEQRDELISALRSLTKKVELPGKWAARYLDSIKGLKDDVAAITSKRRERRDRQTENVKALVAARDAAEARAAILRLALEAQAERAKSHRLPDSGWPAAWGAHGYGDGLGTVEEITARALDAADPIAAELTALRKVAEAAREIYEHDDYMSEPTPEAHERDCVLGIALAALATAGKEG